MHDYIVRLKNIKIDAIHGLHDTEKINKQLFEVDVEIHLLEKESCNDSIENSIDYETIYNLLVDIFENNTFNLIETLGEKVIEKIFMNNNVKSAIITIRKPQIVFDNNSNCIEVSVNKKNE